MSRKETTIKTSRKETMEYVASGRRRVANVGQGRAAPGRETVAGAGNAVRLIEIKRFKTQPRDAFVTAEYRHHWFRTDDRDLKTKRVFSFMMMLFAPADAGEKDHLPLIPIPAQPLNSMITERIIGEPLGDAARGINQPK